MGFIDSHVHLHFPDYEQDRVEVLERAEKAGISAFINVGTDVATSNAALRLAEQNDKVWASAGIHPHDATDAEQDAFRKIEELMKHPRMIAIGEVGLDFFRNLSSEEKQRIVLKHFIEMQKRVHKPLILHCRDAYGELISIFREMRQPPYDGIIHCFSSNRDMLLKLVDLGFYISFAGPLTYKKNDSLRDACRACPLDRLILETDAPFLPPQSKRGKRNESSFLVETAEMAARIHGKGVEELAELTAQNTQKAFRLC